MVAASKVIQGRLNLTNNTSTEGRAAPTAVGEKIYVTRLVVQNKHASVATTLQVLAGATIIHEINCPAAQAAPVVMDFSNTPLAVAKNTALNFKCGTTGADVLVNWGGFAGV